MSGRTRGWCPNVFEPMASGDGLLARVKPPSGRISAAAARELAAAARRWGNGQLELTNRGALQARGFSEGSLPAFRAAILQARLASAEPAVERRRNLVLSPFASPAAAALAVQLERWIEEDATLAALPPKFGFAIEVPDRDPQPLPGDIRFAPDAAGWRVAPAGSKVAGLTADPLAAARAVVSRFIELGAAFDDRPKRMADLVQRSGGEAIFAGTDVIVVEAPPAPVVVAPTVAGLLGEQFALGLAFSAFTADQLDLAAAHSERFAYGWVHVSPWRAFVLSGVADPAGLAAAARAAGFIVDRADPRLGLSACVGAPACASGHAPTRADAAVLSARRPPGHVHVSGCSKGCAHPGRAAFTLIAGADGYGLVRDGRAGDPPQARGLTLEDAAQLLPTETT